MPAGSPPAGSPPLQSAPAVRPCGPAGTGNTRIALKPMERISVVSGRFALPGAGLTGGRTYREASASSMGTISAGVGSVEISLAMNCVRSV